jgi:hypothetical protein
MAMLTLGPAKTAFALQSPTKVAASVNRICFIFIAPLSWDTTVSTPIAHNSYSRWAVVKV